jgi:hypothetical protein
VARFTLHGSPHSLPTYNVALMLRLSSEPFSFPGFNAPFELLSMEDAELS